MAKISIDLSGTGGLIKSSPKGSSNLIYYGQDNEMASGRYNPFVYPGYVAPIRSCRKDLTQSAATRVDLTAIWDKVSGKFMTGGYVNSGAAKINIYAGPDDTTADSNQSFFTTGAIYDFETYQLNGSRIIYFSSYDSTGGAGYVGVTNGTTFTYNWSDGATSTLYTGTRAGSITLANPPFMRTASNGFMYIFSANKVAKVDGTSSGGTAGTITDNVLTVSATQQMTDAVDWKNTIYIAVQEANGIAPTPDISKYSVNCGVFVWDRVSTQVGIRDFIPLYGVKSINRIFVAHDGKLRMFCTTIDSSVQLREFTGNTFETIFELGQYAAPQWWDAVTFSGYATFWMGNDSNIYAHGRPGFGFSNGVYIIGDTTGAEITVGDRGYLYYANSSEGSSAEALIYNFKLTSASESMTRKTLFNFIGTSVPSGYTGGSPGGTFTDARDYETRTKIITLPYLSKVNDLFVFFAPSTITPAATVVGKIKIYLNHSTTAFKSISVTATDIARGYLTIPVGKAFVNAIQIGIDYSSLTTNQTAFGISNDMMPYRAEVDIERTNAHK